jgi:hypothetical protein
MSGKAYVKNAADPKQVKEGGRKERDRRKAELEDIRFLLETPQGKRFIWRLLGHCKTFESIWESSAKVHYNAGMQDLGHFLMGEVVAANDEALLEMMRGSKDGTL